jgi:hypothetical protein
VPELMQGECTAENLAAALERWLSDPEAARRWSGASSPSTSACAAVAPRPRRGRLGMLETHG